MARLPRYASPGMAQHVIQRGNNRSVCFVAAADYRLYLECLVEACAQFDCAVHAYVLMTNHVHLLISPSSASGVSLVVQAVGRKYVRRFNDTYGRTGTLWEGRHKATVVEEERYLFTCYRYIELNPVRAGMVVGPRDYRWSSHRANAFGTRDPVVHPHERYTELGRSPADRQRAYRALCGDELPEQTLSEIRSATNGGWALGGQRFREDVAALLARRTAPAIRGRPPAIKR